MTALKHAVVTARPLRNHGHTNTVKFQWIRLCDVSDEASPAAVLTAMTLQVHFQLLLRQRASKARGQDKEPSTCGVECSDVAPKAQLSHINALHSRDLACCMQHHPHCPAVLALQTSGGPTCCTCVHCVLSHYLFPLHAGHMRRQFIPLALVDELPADCICKE